MITIADLRQLTDRWTQRRNEGQQPLSYKDALSECAFELNQLISNSVQEELDYQDLLEMEADSYLSSMEAHEPEA